MQKTSNNTSKIKMPKPVKVLQLELNLHQQYFHNSEPPKKLKTKQQFDIKNIALVSYLIS